LVDIDYPYAEKIVLVLDNLNTHTIGSLYETFLIVPPSFSGFYAFIILYYIHYIKRDMILVSCASLEDAVGGAADNLMTAINRNLKIAIVYVSSNDSKKAEYVVSELEYIMVNEGFTIIDRSQLDIIRQEQKFQISGEVDDNTAVSIGKILGADIIITGSITESPKLLRMRALNTQTAEVVAVDSEKR
jgi:hypothetical protein